MSLIILDTIKKHHIKLKFNDLWWYIRKNNIKGCMSMKKILVVVDYQNDFVSGTLGFEGAEKLDEAIANKIREYGEGKVFFTRDTHTENYLQTREGRNLPVEHCVEDTNGWEIYGETKKALEEVGAEGFNKESFGLSITDEVANKLPKSVDEVELVGLVSNICVLSNAVIFQTYYPSATIIVDASLTASFDHSLNQKALDVMEGLQVKVINS